MQPAKYILYVGTSNVFDKVESRLSFSSPPRLARVGILVGRDWREFRWAVGYPRISHQLKRVPSGYFEVTAACGSAM